MQPWSYQPVIPTLRLSRVLLIPDYMASYCFPRDSSGARTTRIIATLRSAESGAAAIAFGVNSIGYPLVKVGYINLAFSIVCLVCGGYVIQWVWKMDRKEMYDAPTAITGTGVQTEML